VAVCYRCTSDGKPVVVGLYANVRVYLLADNCEEFIFDRCFSCCSSSHVHMKSDLIMEFSLPWSSAHQPLAIRSEKFRLLSRNSQVEPEPREANLGHAEPQAKRRKVAKSPSKKSSLEKSPWKSAVFPI